MVPPTILRPCDVLALGPHPDDVEIATAGTLLLLRAAGRTITVVDFTRGEMGSRGSATERAAEAAAAAQKIGLLERHNLGLPDTGLRLDDHSTNLLVAALRSSRPSHSRKCLLLLSARPSWRGRRSADCRSERIR